MKRRSRVGLDGATTLVAYSRAKRAVVEALLQEALETATRHAQRRTFAASLNDVT